jgi:hypothetical protein
MAKIKVKRTGRIKKPALDNGKLTLIGNEMVAQQQYRWAKGLNAYGNKAKPLGKRYVFIKRKATGNPRPIRDQKLTGVLLENFKLRKAMNGVIRAENTTRIARQHARQAQGYDEMIGLSGPEQVNILKSVKNEYSALIAKAWVRIQ